MTRPTSGLGPARRTEPTPAPPPPPTEPSLDALRLLLVCPACEKTHKGQARIGNRKSTCRTCNRFAQAVRRTTARSLADAHPEEAEAFRYLAEIDVYALLFPKRMTTDPAPPVGTTEGLAP